MSASVDVIYALHLAPGDLYAGVIMPDAPTRPVQPFAYAMTITEVSRYRDEAGRLMIRPVTASGQLTPLASSDQCLVIRGTS